MVLRLHLLKRPRGALLFFGGLSQAEGLGLVGWRTFDGLCTDTLESFEVPLGDYASKANP